MSVTNSTYDVSGELLACFTVQNCYLSLCNLPESLKKSPGAYFTKILVVGSYFKGAHLRVGAQLAAVIDIARANFLLLLEAGQ